MGDEHKTIREALNAECDAGIGGGCGACKKCDPVWWAAREQEDKALSAAALGYPADWPRCPGCGEPALDGHITCGNVACDEGGHR